MQRIKFLSFSIQVITWQYVNNITIIWQSVTFDPGM